MSTSQACCKPVTLRQTDHIPYLDRLSCSFPFHIGWHKVVCQAIWVCGRLSLWHQSRLWRESSSASFVQWAACACQISAIPAVLPKLGYHTWLLQGKELIWTYTLQWRCNVCTCLQVLQVTKVLTSGLCQLSTCKLKLWSTEQLPAVEKEDSIKSSPLERAILPMLQSLLREVSITLWSHCTHNDKIEDKQRDLTYLQVTWMNHVLSTLWPSYNQAIGKMVLETAEPYISDITKQVLAKELMNILSGLNSEFAGRPEADTTTHEHCCACKHHPHLMSGLIKNEVKARILVIDDPLFKRLWIVLLRSIWL